MAKHDNDPVLRQLVHAVNESRGAGVPVTVSTRGTVLTGLLIAEETYFAELVEASPLMSALQPSAGLLGKEYAKDVEGESGHHLHLRAVGDGHEGRWRISLESVDAWVLREAADTTGDEDQGLAPPLPAPTTAA
jgi:hypothetical protein